MSTFRTGPLFNACLRRRLLLLTFILRLRLLPGGRSPDALGLLLAQCLALHGWTQVELRHILNTTTTLHTLRPAGRRSHDRRSTSRCPAHCLDLHGWPQMDLRHLISTSATLLQLPPAGRRSHDRGGTTRCPSHLPFQLRLGLLLALAFVLAHLREVLLLVAIRMVALHLVRLRLRIPVSRPGPQLLRETLIGLRALPHLLSSVSAIARRRPGKGLPVEADDAAGPAVPEPTHGSFSTGAADGRGFCGICLSKHSSNCFNCTGPATAAGCCLHGACHGA
mmetsp:Transcript_106546/g.282467  ORF Transcript_106546/g.282467 Transcript_106546/m.282467 type:complete len:279 (-) Transcript_106546:956-1792(-)